MFGKPGLATSGRQPAHTWETPGRYSQGAQVWPADMEEKWGSSLTITTRILQRDTLWAGDPETDTSGEGQWV